MSSFASRWNCPERATHNTILSLEVVRVGMPSGNGKASDLAEQVRLAKYITTQEDEAPSLSVEDVLRSLLAQRQNKTRFRWWWS